jgi:hypothetical protein
MPYQLKAVSILAAILAITSTAMAQQPSSSMPAPTGHRQPTLRDLPPGLAHEEQTGEQSNSAEPTGAGASADPQRPLRTKSRSIHYSKASHQNSKASDQTTNRAEMAVLLGAGFNFNPKIPKGQAGGPLPNRLPNCEHPIVPRFCPP